MKKNRISAILFLAVILSVIIYSAYGMVNQGKDDDYISVSVIAVIPDGMRSGKDWNRELRIIRYT